MKLLGLYVTIMLPVKMEKPVNIDAYRLFV
jgi:hypothetical protein